MKSKKRKTFSQILPVNKRPRHRNVKRIQGQRFANSGWQVAIMRSGTTYSKTFYDLHYDCNVIDSFNAAVEFSDKLRADLQQPDPRWNSDHVKATRRHKVHYELNDNCIIQQGRDSSTLNRFEVTCVECLQRIARLVQSGLDPEDESNWKKIVSLK